MFAVEESVEHVCQRLNSVPWIPACDSHRKSGVRQCENDHFKPKIVARLRVVAGVVEGSKESNQHSPPLSYDSHAVLVVEVILGQPTGLIAHGNFNPCRAPRPVEACGGARPRSHLNLKSLYRCRSSEAKGSFRKPLPRTTPHHFPSYVAHFLEALSS